MTQNSPTLDAVKAVLISSLGLQDRAETLSASTALLGSLPELDSLAVVQVIVALEERFGFAIDEDDITADVFETVGSLAAFIETRRATNLR